MFRPGVGVIDDNINEGFRIKRIFALKKNWLSFRYPIKRLTLFLYTNIYFVENYGDLYD
mgnify:CR=1 FL=1